MDTPTSHQPPANQSGLSLDACLSQLAAGTFSYGQLSAFSDLSRDGVRKVAATWPSIEHANRRRLIAEAIELGEENVQYQFIRLYRLALHDEAADIRQLAISGLWEDDSASLLDELLDVARFDESTDVRAAAIARLGDALEAAQQHNEDFDQLMRISEYVTQLAGDRTQPSIIQRRAIEALGAVQPTTVTRALIQEAWEHGDQTVEAGALIAMGRSYEGHWRPLVRSALSGDDPELRFAAAQALGGVGTTDDIAELAELTQDEDLEVRQAAIIAIGEIGGPGAIRVLRNLANEAEESDQDVIADALDLAQLSVDPIRTPR
jgi:HEAT repeat protein